ncbi:MAG: acyl-CoA carboxylase subunit beta [Planctomycetes bacterium]|nr:acyl-CoA carboxylase subunit beta [Planctomycetota bacterium]NOG53671.1 acyl-CoA carboxylase subunit beta [Planctomycetota bacterium]
MSTTSAAGSACKTGSYLKQATDEYIEIGKRIRLGGGPAAIERQHGKNRLTARERVDLLIDRPSRGRGPFMELGLFAAWNMYKKYGGAASAGVVTGIGPVNGRLCMIVANDATVKAGAFFPMTCKKIIRAQMIALQAHIPLIYLVDSAGVFLPLQEDVFPDTDDFGRVFRNNAVLSAQGVVQISAIMGNCVAGGGYLPVLCDTLLMTDGSGLYLAGPALVKAAIGQEVDHENLGGALMHASISGTIDYHEKTEEDCIRRIRSLMESVQSDLPPDEAPYAAIGPSSSPNKVYDLFKESAAEQYDMAGLLDCVIDAGTGNEYKAEYGPSIVCKYARIGGRPCGIVANQRKTTKSANDGVQMPAVIYHEAADKAARFIMDCNQKHLPIIFVHDTTGFMVGRDSEHAGIIRCGAKMVNAMSNCVVPKIVLIVGNSYGAGNYAMCGRAFDPFITYAWPGAKCAVMGPNQAAGTLAQIQVSAMKRRGEVVDEEQHSQILEAVRDSYNEQADIRYGAARLWVDRIIEPHLTREELAEALRVASLCPITERYKTGVLQV